MKTAGTSPLGGFGAQRVLLILGWGLFVLLLVRMGPGRVFSVVAGIGWMFVPVLIVYATHLALRTIALARCIPAGEQPSFGTLLAIRMTGESIQYVTSTGPFLAEPAKALLLRQEGLRGTRAFAATIAEYLIYTFVSATMAIAGLWYLFKKFDVPPLFTAAAGFVIGISGLFLFVAVGAIARRIYLLGAILAWIRRIRWIGKRISARSEQVRETEDLLLEVLRSSPGRFLFVLAIEVVAQALLVLELWLLIRATGNSFPVSYPFVIEAATKFIALGFFFIPGQVGASEGIYSLIFGALGLTASAGFSVALARRMRNIAVSAVGLLILTRFGRRNARQ